MGIQQPLVYRHRAVCFARPFPVTMRAGRWIVHVQQWADEGVAGVVSRWMVVEHERRTIRVQEVCEIPSGYKVARCPSRQLSVGIGRGEPETPLPICQHITITATQTNDCASQRASLVSDDTVSDWLFLTAVQDNDTRSGTYHQQDQTNDLLPENHCGILLTTDQVTHR
jgi:hypothetical protein